MTEVRLTLGDDVVAYFKTEAARLGVPYRTLVVLVLEQSAAERRALQLTLSGLGPTITAKL